MDKNETGEERGKQSRGDLYKDYGYEFREDRTQQGERGVRRSSR